MVWPLPPSLQHVANSINHKKYSTEVFGVSGHNCAYTLARLPSTGPTKRRTPTNPPPSVTRQARQSTPSRVHDARPWPPPSSQAMLFEGSKSTSDAACRSEAKHLARRCLAGNNQAHRNDSHIGFASDFTPLYLHHLPKAKHHVPLAKSRK